MPIPLQVKPAPPRRKPAILGLVGIVALVSIALGLFLFFVLDPAVDPEVDPVGEEESTTTE